MTMLTGGYVSDKAAKQTASADGHNPKAIRIYGLKDGTHAYATENGTLVFPRSHGQRAYLVRSWRIGEEGYPEETPAWWPK